MEIRSEGGKRKARFYSLTKVSLPFAVRCQNFFFDTPGYLKARTVPQQDLLMIEILNVILSSYMLSLADV
jgi:hypothetical protein